MKALAGYRERLLLAVVGLTPQVVTETLYALIVGQRHPFIPTRLHLITTGEGRQRIRLQLLDPEVGALHAFARDYAPSLFTCIETAKVEVLGDGRGHAFTDIASAADSTAAADQIVAAVRQASGDEESAICASIAGGRKSMGFLLGYAMSLFGRPQDRLTHVLVNAPFQDHPGFFYPPPEPQTLFVSPDNRPVSTDLAQVTLTDIPFVRLRGSLPGWLLRGETSFADTVADAQESLAPARMTLRIGRRELVCAGRTLRLPPVDFAFACWLADHWLREGAVQPGLSWREARAADYFEHYARVADEGHRRRVERALAQGVTQEWFEQRVARFNKLVENNLGMLSRYYAIVRQGRRPYSRYGFSPSLADIRIEDDWPGAAP